MLLTCYTLAALAREWDVLLRGATVAEVYSQRPDELAIALEGTAEGEATLVAVLRPGLRLLFRRPGRGRARRNTASLLPEAAGRRVVRVHAPERERMVLLELEGALVLQVVPFGPRPNAWLLAEGDVRDVFAPGRAAEGPPAPRPAPPTPPGEVPATFDALLRAEAAFRGGDPAALEAELGAPAPVVYRHGARIEAFALVPLRHLEARGLRAEPFARVDEAVRVVAQGRLAQERFDARYRSVEARLVRAHERLARTAARMAEELARPSRAERYERFGHLLMAQAAHQAAGATEIVLPDLLADGAPVTIPLDPALTGVANAERYYRRARQARAARAHAEARWAEVASRAERASALLDALRTVERLPDLEAFLRAHAAELEALGGTAGDDDAARLPYRRFPLPGGYEAWVGRDARANAELTTRHARPHDLWLHARGVPGSHVVVRRARTATVPREAVEAAARLAARFSAARTSALVPVQVTERKYVRPLKGGPPGAVRLEREEVLLVEPARDVRA